METMKRQLNSFDWISFGLMTSLVMIGLLFVYSATSTETVLYSAFLQKQFFGVLSGLLLYFVFCFSDYRITSQLGYFAYFAVVLLLIYTLLRGKIGMGAQRWIDLGFVRFQASEVAKLFFPAFFTHYLYTEKDVPVYTFSTFMPILSILVVSCLLILKQPDLGTCLLVFFSGLVLLWLVGINKKFFKWGFVLCLLGAPIGWKILKPYQKQRVMVFLGAGDPRKDRYHIEQSKIAIGSGGLFGKGLKKGTQTQLLFLPESRTDFIFAVLCEEWGFLGALLLLLLYTLLFCRLLYKILSIKPYFAQLLALGLIISIMLSCFINIAMVGGLLPVVGIPLPLISYGVTSLWITLASLGWIQGIIMRAS